MVAVAESIQGFGGWTSIVVHVPADFVYLGPLGDIPMEACKPSQIYIYIYYIIYIKSKGKPSKTIEVS